MIAYKGFEKGLICLGYHFQMGMNITDKANCAANGFHCAENRWTVLLTIPVWKTQCIALWMPEEIWTKMTTTVKFPAPS